MSDPAAAQVSPTGQTSQPSPLWLGWIAFAGTMMILLGSFHVIAGLVALLKEEYFLVGKGGLVVSVDYTAWGWAHLILGLVVGLAGLGLFSGNFMARIVAVALAMFSAIANLAFLSAYPLWSTIMIAVDIMVIYAVMVHGDRRTLSSP